MAGLAGTVLALGVIAVMQTPPAFATCMLLAACALPMWWLEATRFTTKVPIHATSKILLAGKRQSQRLGLASIIITGAATLQVQRWLAPAWISGFYDLAPFFFAGLVLWAAWYLTRPPRQSSFDAIESLGIALRRCQRKRKLRAQDRTILLGWMVKIFFLPLMLGWTHVWVSSTWFASQGYREGASLFVMGMAVLYAVDTAFGTIGYLSTSRRIGAQIRSVDSTWLGWLSALACYPPLSMLVLHQWLVYKDGYEWQAWLAGNTWASNTWGTAILLLTAVYTWSTVVFGPRFSNLTHRGIITSGPFRYTKHPAYISKNLSWWMISVPFVSNAGAGVALTHCAALLGVNAIYWLRAKTEERHLMHDPVYREYAAWIARHGIFARLKRAGRAS